VRVIRSLRASLRYLSGGGRFLRDRLSPERCRELVASQLRSRDASFLRILERGVFAHRGSPYRWLLERARIGFPDVVALVEREGLEAALARLHREGVYVTLEELKGRRPIRRGGAELAVRARDFDNPLLAAAYEASTGGSRGPGTRVLIDPTSSSTRPRITRSSSRHSVSRIARSGSGCRCFPE
jgi:hypothetical protein